MVHIGYFSLLLFCISTNMIQGMGFSQNAFNLQTEEKTGDLWGWNSTDSNETSNSSMLSPLEIITPKALDLLQTEAKTVNQWKWNSISSDETSSELVFFGRNYFTSPKESSNSSDIFAEMSFTTNRSFNSQQDPGASYLSINSSSTTQQYPLPTASRNKNDLVDPPQQIPDSDIVTGSDTEEFFNSENIPNPFKNITFQQTSSLSSQQIGYSQQQSTESFETAPQPQQSIQQSRPLSSLEINRQSIELGKRKSPIPSDVEDSTTFNQNSLVSEQPSPRRLRRKIKINGKNIPDNAYFIIICYFCSYQPEFYNPNRNTIIRNFERHMKKKPHNYNPKRNKKL